MTRFQNVQNKRIFFECGAVFVKHKECLEPNNTSSIIIVCLFVCLFVCFRKSPDQLRPGATDRNNRQSKTERHRHTYCYIERIFGYVVSCMYPFIDIAFEWGFGHSLLHLVQKVIVFAKFASA